MFSPAEWAAFTALLAIPAGLLPMLYGFRFDDGSIGTDCVRVELDHDHRPEEPNPIHVKAAHLRTVLGAGMFGFGFVFPVFADQLDSSAQNRHIPQSVRSAAERLPAVEDLIAAVIIDATGRQWWAVAPRHVPNLGPILLHLPATAPENWRIPESLDASLWTAALALDDTTMQHCCVCALCTQMPVRPVECATGTPRRVLECPRRTPDREAGAPDLTRRRRVPLPTGSTRNPAK
ncbi:hypothetical protein [Nocardia flavorosea]|uniref:Uncharacterized protein n=1 Tax=Nocardia flavorosea TaxID=53429 RepID=A0A846YSV3_9NOCA|nr:hypothetical protein [Nocardia flavorosea]NKY60059.1 hypothetical protein [Nocardia flavorosea]